MPRKSLSQPSPQVIQTPILAPWPSIPWQAWEETATTLHRWMQVVGKVKLALATPVNHWWHVAFMLTSRGMSTGPMRYPKRAEEGWVQIDFDFIAHRLVISSSTGERETVGLAPISVAAFYRTFMERLDRLGCRVHIWTMPVEMANPIPFEEDEEHQAYDAEAAHHFWIALLHSAQVMEQFRSLFIGKASPVQFFWGSFDLATSRFSGRKAPLHAPVPNLGDFVVQEAYSHEVSSCGFWPGNALLPEPAYFAYTYPAPPGVEKASIQPGAGRFDMTLGEFILPYEAVQKSKAPEALLLAFFQSTYQAAADLSSWDRAALER